MQDQRKEKKTYPPMDALLDAVIEALHLKNDAALSRMMQIAPPVVSKLRHGVLPFGAVYIIRIHELTDWPIATIKSFIPK